MKESLSIVLAAGGTGGHIFPAEALMEELTHRGHHVAMITDNRYLNYKGNETIPKNVHIIRASSMKKGAIGKMAAIYEISHGIFQASALLKQLKPKVVVGFGGYPSFPTMIDAIAMGYRTVIHEQNSLVGAVNRLSAPFVRTIATSFPEVVGISDNNASKIILTGNPVRMAIRAIRDMPYPELKEGSILKILVIGGSQGASVFSDVIPAAIETLPESYRRHIRIDQQCRVDDLDKARAHYNRIGVSADLAPFFSDIPARLASAHLVIARAGASSLAEFTVAGRPAILVPLPHSAGDHQLFNAQALEDKGGGWVMPQEAFTVAALSARLEAFFGTPATLVKAGELARKAGHPNAVADLSDVVEKLALS